uniref:CBY1 interacting BAR domain containing 2 n=1 Tax=Labrus bergylta TaxID=56723 RepID=A0A3Q3GTJ3_9LABR
MLLNIIIVLGNIRDVQVKSMEQTVKHAEKHLGELCSLLASYTRKTAKLRDKADLLVAQLFDFSSTEDPELQIGLKNLAEDLSMVQDYRQAQVERLETRVVAPLKAYGDTVKNKRVDLKKLSTDLNKELKELQKLEKMRLRNPADRQGIAEVNAQKASNNAHRSIRQLEETITDFQRQKLEDMKRIFIDFITVEMLFHAKALEVYTHTYHNLEGIDTQKDLEDFKETLVSFETPDHEDQTEGRIPLIFIFFQSRSTLQRQRGMEEEEELEEEDEDEDEEEEMYESEIEDGQNTSRKSYAAQYAQMHRWQK